MLFIVYYSISGLICNQRSYEERPVIPLIRAKGVERIGPVNEKRLNRRIIPLGAPDQQNMFQRGTSPAYAFNA